MTAKITSAYQRNHMQLSETRLQSRNKAIERGSTRTWLGERGDMNCSKMFSASLQRCSSVFSFLYRSQQHQKLRFSELYSDFKNCSKAERISEEKTDFHQIRMKNDL